MCRVVNHHLVTLRYASLCFSVQHMPMPLIQHSKKERKNKQISSATRVEINQLWVKLRAAAPPLVGSGCPIAVCLVPCPALSCSTPLITRREGGRISLLSLIPFFSFIFFMHFCFFFYISIFVFLFFGVKRSRQGLGFLLLPPPPPPPPPLWAMCNVIRIIGPRHPWLSFLIFKSFLLFSNASSLWTHRGLFFLV